MMCRDKVAFISLKHFLFLMAVVFAVAGALLITFFSSAATATGSRPDLAISLAPGPNTGVLRPGEQRWYRLVANGHQIQDLAFSLFFTPDDGHRRHQVNFELFAVGEVEMWQRGHRNSPINFGAGTLVSRDGDPNTGERIWRGPVMQGETYFLAVENGTNTEIDYWIFDNDVTNPELGPQLPPANTEIDHQIFDNDVANPEPGPQSVPTPVPVFALGAAPQTAVPVQPGQNKGGLEPGQEIWYSFSSADQNQEYFEEMAFTMIVTPDDGNRIHHVSFEVFTAAGVQDWSPGNSQISNVGAGSVVYRDNNPWTGERVWSGWVVDYDLYYVRIRNGANVHMDYWLFTGDVYRPELG